MPILSYSRVAAVCLLALISPITAGASPSSAATQLVSAMRLDFAALDALQWGIHMDKSQSSNVYACLKSQDFRRFTPLLAELLEGNLTTTEMEFALRFYSSPAGVKFTNATLVERHRRHDPTNEDAYPEFSKQELTEISEFMKSEEIKKLSELMSAPPGVKELATQVLVECTRTSGQLRHEP